MISAQVIADSICSQTGERITSMVITLPRIVLAEFNTHRAFSRNSASSRAIPFEKMIAYVKTNPFVPMKWMLDHKGMQGTEFVTDPEKIVAFRAQWLIARDAAVEHATKLHQRGLTKQVCNRILEPFLMHTIICTSTDWENFFALRAHEAAEIHIAEAARQMLMAYNDSIPKQLKAGQWHIPFGDKIDGDRLIDLMNEELKTKSYVDSDQLKIKIATARCARVSYMNFDGTDDYKKDVELHDRLATQGHWSPFEHCAVALDTPRRSGNFNGWGQYRKQFANENRSDERVIRKDNIYDQPVRG